MSRKGNPVTLPDGRVIYVNIDDMDQLDINPRVKLDRFGIINESRYCGGECEVKDEVDDGSYNDSRVNNVADESHDVKMEADDELSNFKMEADDEEINAIAREVMGKITTSECDVEQEGPTTQNYPDMNRIEMSSDDEFRGFGFSSPIRVDNELDPLTIPVQEPEASRAKKNPYRGNRISIKNLKSMSPEPHRKTIATSPFKDIEASFGTNPLILPDEDESLDSDMPHIVSSTSMLPLQQSTSAPPDDDFMIVDNPSCANPPAMPGLLSIKSIVPKPQVLLQRPKSRRIPPASKIVRLHEACCLIDKLSKRRFASDGWWSAEEREKIVLDGKPSVNYDHVFGFKLHGDWLVNFQKLKWLTGCVDRKKLYCWTCLLFSEYGGSWVFSASQGLESLEYAFKQHSYSQEHKQSEVRERQWLKRNVYDKSKSQQKLTVQSSSSDTSNKRTNISSKTDSNEMDEESYEIAGKTLTGQVHSYATMGMKPNNDHQKPCLVRMLLKNNFVRGTWKEGEQDEIVTQGRRCPNMEYVFGSFVSGYSETILTDHLYVKYPWLTGSWEIKKLYCWPCLLYNTENSCLELSETSPAAVFDDHEILNSHLESSLCLKLLEHDIKNRSMKGNVEPDHEATKKKREFLKHLTDVVCITKTTLKNSGPSEEDYAELLKLIASYNLNLEGFLNETSDATGKDGATYLVSNYAGGILTAIAHVMMKKIKRDVQNSPFVSIMLDDVKGLINKSFVSVIIRYVEENGEVRERFVKFIEVGYNRTSGNMFRQVMSVVNELGCESRLVGFTYDGAVIEPTDVKKFNAEMSGACTSAMFFHNRNHNLKFLIQQALSHLKECRHFFQHLVPLLNFFNSTPAAINALIELDCETAEDTSSAVWDFSIDFITTIRHHYPAMLKLLENINAKPNDWDIEHVVQAPYYLGFLRNLQNRFFIVLLSDVFAVVGELAAALQRDFDFDDWTDRLNEATTQLLQMSAKLDDICQTACSNSLVKDDVAPTEQVETLKESNMELYDNLLTCIINFISTRTENTENLKFFDRDIISGIVDKSRDGTKEIIDRLTTTYSPVFSPLFNITKLRAQLDFHFGHKCFKPIKSINELMKDMYEYEISSTMAELYRLMGLILTIPVASNFIEKTTSYERMASYVKSNIHNLSTINAFIWMEKDMLERLQEEEHFYEWVINHFAKKPGREQFRLPTSTKNK